MSLERNHEVTGRRPLLREDGSLREPGWSRQAVQVYDRSAIKASALRIKEWDYYIILSDRFGIAFTVSDLGYLGLHSVTFFDFEQPKEITKTIITPFPLGKTALPASSSQGVTAFQNKKINIRFEALPGVRKLTCRMDNFAGGKPLSCDIELQQPEMDTLVIATPWKEKKTAFYYNQKINCMRASGGFQIGENRYTFDPDTDYGTLDWGRGVWTYDNNWFWGSGNGTVEGKPFGFNLGYGFGNTAAASENIIHYDGKGHKIDNVKFNIPEDSYMKPWTFVSSDGRFEGDFIPVIDRAAKINIGLINTDQHQVFGRLTGKAVLDDGKVLTFKNLLCFAEDVRNRY